MSALSTTSRDQQGAGVRGGPGGGPAARLRVAKTLGTVVVLALLLLAPTLGLGGYWTRTFMLVGTLALLVSSLNIVLGYAGELAVGQVFLYAAGAYIAGYVGTAHGVTNVLAVFGLALVGAVLVGLITGVPGLRLGGWSLAIMTFFLIIIIPNLIDVLGRFTGGSQGLAVPLPTFFNAGLSSTGLYILIIAVVIAWFAIARNLILSRHGNAFLVLKQSYVLAGSLGISVFRMKLLVYVIGAVPACLAGVLFAWLQSFISPDTFTFSMTLGILAASVIGGSTSIYGAVLGAILLQIGQQTFASFPQWQLVIYGAFLLIAAVLLSDGLSGLARNLWRRALQLAQSRGWVPQPRAAHDVDAARAAGESKGAAEAEVEAGGSAPAEGLGELPGAVLSTNELTKVFGGNRAVDGVSIEARPGEVTALIGPNGSGKTTLLNLICGFYQPTSGSALLSKRDITGSKPHQVARAGVARTFQTPLIPHGMTTREFVATGRYVAHAAGILTSVLRLPGFRRGYVADDADAMRLLRLLDIEGVAAQEVSELPLGTRRLVEVARGLAQHPGLVLLDEAGSGLDQSDLVNLERAISMIREAGGTVILVEHNFPFVLKLADRIHVLSRGQLMATGTPAEIQSNARVLEEFAGAAAAEQAAGTPGSGDAPEPGDEARKVR
jgi:branched-chain amino acid transport system permease protein